MIAINSEEMIRLVTTYLNCPSDVVKDLIAHYDVVDINTPKRGDLFLTTLGKVALVEYGYSGPPVLIVRRKRQLVDSKLCTPIAVDDIYDRPVEIPDGYEFVDFRSPISGDTIIDSSRRQLVLEIGDNCEHRNYKRFYSPRVIIRKVS